MLNDSRVKYLARHALHALPYPLFILTFFFFFLSSEYYLYFTSKKKQSPEAVKKKTNKHIYSRKQSLSQKAQPFESNIEGFALQPKYLTIVHGSDLAKDKRTGKFKGGGNKAAFSAKRANGRK